MIIAYLAAGAGAGAIAGLIICAARRPDKGDDRKRMGMGGFLLIGLLVGGAVGAQSYVWLAKDGEKSEYVVEIESEKHFDEIVLGSDIPVLVKFHMPGCPPCRKMAPVVEKIAGETKGRALVVSVDIVEQDALSKRYNVYRVPRFFVFRGGRKVKDLRSIVPKEALLNALDVD